MDVLERPLPLPPGALPGAPPVEVDEAAARRSLREQIARLERDVASAAVAAYPRVDLSGFATRRAGPRLLSLGELEVVRDELATRLAELRSQVGRDADRQEDYRVLIERMLLQPGSYKWVRVKGTDIGEHVCKSWHVRPRLGLIGMMAGWWHVKVSSGCPRSVAP